jgi:hypothetical protein
MTIRFPHIALLLVAAITLPGTSALPTTLAEKSCRQHPRLVGKCFTIHGRLSVYNGAPALRIWRVGTRRMLGVSGQRFSEPGYRNIPIDLEKQINQDVEIFADYFLCPFTRSKPGEMQLVCIESVKHLEIKKRS